MTRLLLILLLLIVPVSAYAYNSGFTPIYQPNLPSSGAINNTLSSVGHAESIVSGQILNDHQFKGIGCGGDIVCSSNNTDVTISYTDGLGTGEANTASSSGLGFSLVLPKSGIDLPFRGIFCAGDLLCSSNGTDVRISYIDTPGGSSALDDLTDVIITSPALFSTLFYNGAEWIDKIFTINSQSATNGNFITGINNQTGVITTQTFKINTQSSSVGNFISGIDNSTGVITTQTLKSNTTTCSGTDKFSAYNNSTGTFTCSTDQSGSGGAPRGGYLMAHWDQSSTKTNIGTSFVNVYTQTNANGNAILMDTDTFTEVRLYIQWNKVGAGTQTCQVINGATALVSTDVVSGANDSGWDAIPAGLLNAENAFRLQCKSTTAADDPIFESASVWMK